MACAAVFGRLHDDRKISHHRLSNHPLIDRRACFLAADLRAEREHLVLIIDHGRAINRCHAANRVDSAAHRAFPPPAIFVFLRDFMMHKFGKRRERGRHRVENRLRDRITPALAFRRHDEKYAAVSVCAHRCAQLDEDIQRVVWLIRRRRSESKQRAQECWTVRQARAFLVDDFHLLALDDGYVRILSEPIETTMLDDEQPRLNIFKHETEARNRSRCAPNSQLVAMIPDAEMDLGTLDSGREFSKHTGGQWERMFEDHRLSGSFRRQVRNRDLGEPAFFRSKAGPESRVNDRRDRVRVGFRCKIGFAHASRFSEMACKVFFDERCCYIRRLVCWGHAHTLLKINAGHEKAQKAQRVMRKVLVIGSGGSGKSTVAAQLGELLNLEVSHLDRFYWRAGWVEPETEEWIKTVTDLIERDSWILDGNYSGSLELRLAKCDTVVFLDLSRVLCLWRIVKRFFLYRNGTRPDVAEGCREQLSLEFV